MARLTREELSEIKARAWGPDSELLAHARSDVLGLLGHIESIERDAHENYAQELRDAIRGDWFDLTQLRNMTIVSLIDHAVYCRQKAGENLVGRAGDGGNEGRIARWAAYCNQADFCLMVLHERGVYEDDPTRDDKDYQYIGDAE